MTTACIIQARLGSTRLPAKVLLPLPTGDFEQRGCVLGEVIKRCREIEGVTCVICAVSDDPASDIVAEFAEEADAIVCRGSETDVLGRYYKAARQHDIDTIIRVTADCPALNPHVVKRVLDKFNESGADYASNVHPRTFTHGYDCEVFSFGALWEANKRATDPYDREHVCPWMVKNLRTVNVENETDRSGERLVLDTLDDYVKVYAYFAQSASARGEAVPAAAIGAIFNNAPR